MELPLRIAVEHAACRVLGSSAAACLDDAGGGVVLVLAEAGVVALAPPGVTPTGWAGALPGHACSKDPHDASKVQWWRVSYPSDGLSGGSSETPPPTVEVLPRPPSAAELARGAKLDPSIATRVVKATHR